MARRLSKPDAGDPRRPSQDFIGVAKSWESLTELLARQTTILALIPSLFRREARKLRDASRPTGIALV
jgi:hypothetical protein